MGGRRVTDNDLDEYLRDSDEALLDDCVRAHSSECQHATTSKRAEYVR